MTRRCDFSELPEDQCAHCRVGSRTLPREIELTEAGPEKGPWITAAHPGRCSLNRAHRIQPGTQIRADGDGGWLCASCG